MIIFDFYYKTKKIMIISLCYFFFIKNYDYFLSFTIKLIMITVPAFLSFRNCFHLSLGPSVQFLATTSINAYEFLYSYLY